MIDLETPRADLDDGLCELARLIDRTVEPGGAGEHYDAHRRFGSVWALRASEPTAPSHALYTPMLCVIAQGAKQLLLGDDIHIYDRGRFLLNSVALPAAGQVIEATLERPCLWVMIELDAALVGSVIVEAGASPSGSIELQRAAETNSVDRPLLDAVLRLARLFETPQDFGFLAPLALREIIYRLLQGDQATRLHQIAARGAKTHRVVRVIEWLRLNFDKPLTIEHLAKQSSMSVSALHHHFKEVTAMTPLQFQKQMRMQEAKRLMVSQGMDAAGAGHRVGYDDPSYFSRDYRRFFGAPPRRHVARVRAEVRQSELQQLRAT